MLTDHTKAPLAKELRRDLLERARLYFAQAFTDDPFLAELHPVPVSGRSLDESDLLALVDASLDLWLTGGRYHDRFEREFAAYIGTRDCVLTNSGSSANLLALAALTSPEIGRNRLQVGDDVITAAAGFPTTVNPIVQLGCTPVFIDSELTTYNVDLRQLERALSTKTRAVILAHTLGNPFDAARVARFCREHNLWFIEDTCDAIGAQWQGQNVGTFGHLATASFYPAHHITMGEGGAVLCNAKFGKIVRSFRDWGRDCWCPTGCDNTCGRRFEQHQGDLPAHYDHKYTYTHLGYNLKVTDMQAALGCSQLARLPEFLRRRAENAERLWLALASVSWLKLPGSASLDAKNAWFGFPLRILPDAPVTRDQLVAHLEARKIGTRLLFGGNLTRQPAYRNVGITFGPLANANTIMRDVLWVGCWPGLDAAAMDYIAQTIVSAGREMVA